MLSLFVEYRLEILNEKRTESEDREDKMKQKLCKSPFENFHFIFHKISKET